MAAPAGTIHVLCVDDDPDYVDLIETYLERDDELTVWTTTSPTEALEHLEERGDGIDCIVSDHDMPEYDGIELLKRVREAHGRLPFILFTGKGSETIAADAVQAGVDSYLQKGGPETYDLLAEEIKQQVAKRRAEQANQRYETIIEALGDPVYVTDERGHFTFVNDAFTTLTGYTESELLGEHPSIIKTDESVEDVETALRGLLRNEGPEYATIEVEITTADGETVSCEDHIGVLPSETGGYQGSVGTLRDISERAERIRRLRRERNRAAVLFEESPSPIVRIRFEDSEPIVKEVNRAFEETFGYLEPEVVNESLDAFIVSPNGESRADEINRRVSQGETVQAEIERQTVAGPRRFLLNAAAIEADDSEEGYAIYVDISERHRREQVLADRVREFERFGDVMAHDLRNQLNIALGHLELVQEATDHDSLAAMERVLDRLDELIGDLANVMRSGSIVDEPIDTDLATVSTEVWETIDAPSDRLNVESAGTIRADVQALKRLLENLFQNSLDHAGEDVTVRVGRLPDGFYVEDDGKGIDEAERSDVFLPGYTTTEDGTGFGLTSVRQIAAGHGWEVRLAESHDGGLRVEFTGVETR